MLIEGPFESDYSLAIVNRRLALALKRAGEPVRCHQRDNTTSYAPSAEFLADNPELAPYFIRTLDGCSEQVHSRCIYPPFTDDMVGAVRAMHCYAWEESVFPEEYAEWMNRDLDLVTVTSEYVRTVLRESGVVVPIEVAGNGADHILEAAPERVTCFDGGKFHFVHVSSCFPRKGADVLVEAFCREFRREHGVSLIVKTFRNPHNDIEQVVANAASRYPRHAPIRLVFDSFSPGQMRSLIEGAGCLVAPSRGEGFGLPVAEAMFLGTPVVATIHGGHADLCSPEWCWPVDFRLEPARTHLTQGRSLWAEPDCSSLAARMREVYESGSERVRVRTERAREHVASRFTWAEVAKRHKNACTRVFDERRRGVPPVQVAPPRRIGFVTTWNVRCGIAEYTRYLIGSLSPECSVSVFADRVSSLVRPDESNVERCWTAGPADLPSSEIDALVERICTAGCDAVSIQHNFGLLSPASVERLVGGLKARHVAVIATLHATTNERFGQLATALCNADSVIVHREEDRRRVAGAGISSVTLLPQGIYVPDHIERSAAPGGQDGAFTVSCFGFFLPPKGIYELLSAFAAAASVNGYLRLKLLNSLYSSPESYAYAAECFSLIRSHKLADRVLVCTEFLDQSAILTELADSDLVVLPYTHSTESSSAAIRLPLASTTPVLCSDLPLFREFEGVVHFYPAQDTVALANRLLELAADAELLRKYEAKQREYVNDLSWRRIGMTFQSIAGSCIAASANFVQQT